MAALILNLLLSIGRDYAARRSSEPHPNRPIPILLRDVCRVSVADRLPQKFAIAW